MMDYPGLYHDLAEMQRRAFREALRLDLIHDEPRSRELTYFIWDIDEFMSDITLRQWSP